MRLILVTHVPFVKLVCTTAASIALSLKRLKQEVWRRVEELSLAFGNSTNIVLVLVLNRLYSFARM